MRCLPALACSFAAMLLAVSAASADTLKVGPNQKYAKPSEAFRAAKDGDAVEIDSAGAYGGDVAAITANGLAIRGVGPQRVKLPANGHDAGGKAIWVIRGNDATVENIEFSGARVRDKNGAGIRPEGRNLTVRNCRFYDCENGILGGAGEVLIEHCEFEHCGPVPDPATHSLYIGQSCTKLVFRYNYSTDVIQGHLLKTRAKESWVLYNRLTDENGTGSAVADFPNGGLVVVIGNIMQKGPRAQNTRVIAYGMEGIKYERNALYVVNNTMVYQNHRPTSCFVRVEKTPEGFRPVIVNNVCVGAIPLCNIDNIEAGGNLLLKSVAEAGFVDPAGYNYHLKAGSPCISKAAPLGKVDDFDLKPRFQYVHPAKAEPRPVVGLLDVGALEYAPPGAPGR